MTTNSWSFEYLTSWDAVWNPSFVEQWSRWLDESPTAHVFFHPTMVRAWVETYLPLRNIKPIFVVAKCGSTTAFLPLVLWRRNWKNAWQRLLAPVGYSDFDYHDPILVGCEGHGGTAIDFWNALPASLLHTLGRDFDLLSIDGIRSPSAGQGTGWTQGETCPWTDLTPFTKPEDFLPSLKRNLRNSIRRRQHRITEAGGLSTITFGPEQTEEVLRELPAFLETHSRRWPYAYKAPGFHSNLIRYGLPARLLLLHVVRFGGEIAASSIGFSFRGRYYAYMPAMVERFSNLSPGKMMMLYQYEHAIAIGNKIFDHLRGAEEYKSDWPTVVETLWQFDMPGAGAGAAFRNTVVTHVKPLLRRTK